ncbi:NAD(P)H-dependent flavin oxidoreductase [Maridesulfovibrio hydrothermalis]|uniref:2-nitropropane dioxygenase NPD n=1 Tax=Maridesulfovibrio hydrothermalis AM13 = DSM 14728 TaxID=1121451 RepID=L0RBB2_9BACT|nr:nitronate monooxygenase family protein [Maridesulfovibrio hydrothermalis]CCO24078.1 2-nitropropane dioxygenase NPD [Maridesulfovibrio hydrothermalis AM13 = DSM 14728]
MNLPQLKIGDLVAKVPVIQGGMGVGISLSGLASAVAKEGGIGVIAAAMIGLTSKKGGKDHAKAHIDALTDEIRKAKEMTSGILGVNIMVALSNFADMVSTSVKEGADVIFSGAGLPLDLPKYVSEETKTKLVPIVSSGRAASIICKKWISKFDYIPDAFVVEGPKAGGHLGFKREQLDDPKFSLEEILPEVIKAVKPYEEKTGRTIPVIAAGGVYSGEDICKYLQMGAAGVQMGTRFVATHECDADDKFKQTYVDSTKEDMAIIQSPVGLPGRAVKNDFLQAVTAGEKTPFKCPFHCIKSCKVEKSPYCIAAALINAQRGKLKNGFAFAGSNAWRTEKIISVKQLFTDLKSEFDKACAS